jgi:hypothetical protein
VRRSREKGSHGGSHLFEEYITHESLLSYIASEREIGISRTLYIQSFCKIRLRETKGHADISKGHPGIDHFYTLDRRDSWRKSTSWEYHTEGIAWMHGSFLLDIEDITYKEKGRSEKEREKKGYEYTSRELHRINRMLYGLEIHRED